MFLGERLIFATGRTGSETGPHGIPESPAGLRHPSMSGFHPAVSVNRNPKDGTSATSTGEMAGENRRKDFPFLPFRFRPTVPD